MSDKPPIVISPGTASSKEGRHVFRWAAIAAIVMVALALTGVGLSTSSPQFSAKYWMSLVPVFGFLCILTAWLRTKKGHSIENRAIIRQVFHWLGIAVAIAFDYFIRGTGEESAEVAGMNALLLLAVGCFLAGVHLEWTFCLVGVLLCGTIWVVTKEREYQWLIFLGGGLIVAGIIGGQILYRRARHRK